MLHQKEGVHPSIDDEVGQALTRAAMIDRISIGRIEVRGVDRLDFLHRLSTNDLLSVRQGYLAPTVFVTDKGRIIDYVHVLVGESGGDLLTSPGAEDRLVAWLERYHIMEDVSFSVRTVESATFMIVGPQAGAFVARVLSIDLPPNRHVISQLNGYQLRAIHIHERGVHLAILTVPAGDSDRFREVLVERAAAEQIPVIGTRGYEMWKCLMGVPSQGAELSESYNPYEAGLRHAISLTKGCYIGQEVIARLDTYQKVQRKLVSCEFEKPTDAKSGTPVFSPGGEEIGRLTSISEVPFRGRYPALAIVRREWAQPGGTVAIHSGSPHQEGTITKDFERTPE